MITGNHIINYRAGGKRNIKTLTLEDFYLYFNSAGAFSKKHPKAIKTLVKSNASYTIVDAILHKGIQQVRTIILDNGFNVTTTANQKIGVGYADFMAARDLMEDDFVRVCLEDNIIDLVRIKLFSTWSEQTVYGIVCGEPYRHFLANHIHIGC